VPNGLMIFGSLKNRSGYVIGKVDVRDKTDAVTLRMKNVDVWITNSVELVLH
jgi:hypothetical protein